VALPFVILVKDDFTILKSYFKSFRGHFTISALTVMVDHCSLL
jgi:hypothetical protein